MPIWATRCWTLSLTTPAAARPATSPFTSAMKTGTPGREKPSASTSSETVLPVHVAPATRQWRFPYLASKDTGCSPLPISMLSTFVLSFAAVLPRARPRGVDDVDEVQEVELSGRVAELGQAGRRFAAMLGAVIHLMDELLPERVRPELAPGVPILDDGSQTGRGEPTDEGLRVPFDAGPAFTDRGQIRKRASVQQGRRRSAVPALQPDPLSGHGMHQRVAKGLAARAPIGQELLDREGVGRGQDTSVRPGVVPIQRLDRFQHASSSMPPAAD